MNNHIVLECKDCKAILVVNKKDFWHNIRCTICDSYNVVNLDEEFDQIEVVDEDNKINTLD